MAERRLLDEILHSFRRGDVNEEEASARILELFYEGSENFLLDMEREKRLGFPEVIYAEGKRNGDLMDIVGRMLEKQGRVFVASLSPEAKQLLHDRFLSHGIRNGGRVMVIGSPRTPLEPLGTAGIITAGTSDIPFAEESMLLLEELGVTVIKSYDSGVAGIHRPHMSLQRMQDASVLIVFAGMEGALPTVLASLTDLPVIAVPTPVGYGFGGQGEAALKTMLQSCSPGLTVLNIGNSVGAAAAAVRILRVIRRCQPQSE
ncbi:MAG: nickel pincer cofactor biosynthesis protein LarB [Dehalococcoidia bacterium]|nr:nickel pincer cofactor biosynthesis protein LarB [Dehalococcoidia bacterium]